MKETLTGTKDLTNAMLAALDNSMKDLSRIDNDISKKIKRAVENYTAD